MTATFLPSCVCHHHEFNAGSSLPHACLLLETVFAVGLDELFSLLPTEIQRWEASCDWDQGIPGVVGINAERPGMLASCFEDRNHTSRKPIAPNAILSSFVGIQLPTAEPVGLSSRYHFRSTPLSLSLPALRALFWYFCIRRACCFARTETPPR
jgi:hypothetical protein